MRINAAYQSDHFFVTRLYDHVKLALAPTLEDREDAQANLLEKVGDHILYAVDSLPKAIKAVARSFQDPRVVTIALTALALLGVSFAFYPGITLGLTKSAIAFMATYLKQIPFWAVKFSAYLLTCTTIVGYGLRAEGRFTNAQLMNKFYGLDSTGGNPGRMMAGEIHAARTVS